MRGWIARAVRVVLMAMLITACGEAGAVTLPPAGQIFVADAGNRRLVRINDMTGAGWTTFSPAGSRINKFVQPYGIFVSPAGQIFVTDSNNDRIVRVDDMAGGGWTTFGTPGSGINQFSFNGFLATAFVSATGQIYIADTHNHRIVRVNDMTGRGWTTFGTPGSGINQFRLPSGIFVNDAGQIFVSDSNNGRIVRINDMTGAGWTTFGTSGSGINQFGGPTGIFVNASGQIFVADPNNGRIVRINDMTGAGWTSLGGQTAGSENNQFSSPAAIFVQ